MDPKAGLHVFEKSLVPTGNRNRKRSASRVVTIETDLSRH